MVNKTAKLDSYRSRVKELEKQNSLLIRKNQKLLDELNSFSGLRDISKNFSIELQNLRALKMSYEKSILECKAEKEKYRILVDEVIKGIKR